MFQPRGSDDQHTLLLFVLASIGARGAPLFARQGSEVLPSEVTLIQWAS